MFLLDTDHVSLLQQDTAPERATLLRRMQEHTPDAFFVSIISFQEQAAGWNAYLNRAKTTVSVIRAYQMFELILRDFSSTQTAPFDDAAAEVFADLRKQRVRIGTLDLRIASIAVAKQLTVLTRNLVDFKQVPGLDVEDWTQPD